MVLGHKKFAVGLNILSRDNEHAKPSTEEGPLSRTFRRLPCFDRMETGSKV